MIRAFKTFLLWLLIAALPLQGMAAALKASCGPAHHSSTAAVTMAHGNHHDVQATHDHHYDHLMAHSDSVGSDSAATADESSSHHQHKSSYCSACAACCAGAVAPPAALIWPPVYTSSEIIVVPPPVLVAGYVPDGLERPPRYISA
jgi:hypothetical protein